MPDLVYHPITQDSNLEPLSVEIKRKDGTLVGLVGATGTITIKDEDTGARLVDAAPVIVTDPGRASFALPANVVAKISRRCNWLVEWRVIMPGALTWRSPVIKLPVRPKL